ncbi:unnamed protein product [Lupinus luteus]|uniref:Uncharacterized protein n=1 Tax=Lupinus luteus TaxID=3873 RepID=A0AAV1Y2F9_LUPLU
MKKPTVLLFDSYSHRQHFRQQTRGSEKIYEQGGSSHASGSDVSRLQNIDFNLRSTNVDLVRSRSAKQPKITGRFMDAARKKLRETVGKFIIYERMAMNVTRSPWFHNLIIAAAQLFKHYQPMITSNQEGEHSLDDFKPVSSCNRYNPTVITSEFDNIKINKSSNIIAPLTNSHASFRTQPKSKGMISWSFPRFKKKHNKNGSSPNRTKYEEVPHDKDLGLNGIFQRE